MFETSIYCRWTLLANLSSIFRVISSFTLYGRSSFTAKPSLKKNRIKNLSMIF